MKCPKCGNELKRSQKNPEYGLCYNCKLKFKWKEETLGKNVCENCGTRFDGRFCPECGCPNIEEEGVINTPKEISTPKVTKNKKTKWYEKTFFIVLMLIFLWPVGLVLMWKFKKNWNKVIKIILTILFVFIGSVSALISAFVSDDFTESDNVVQTDTVEDADSEEVEETDESPTSNEENLDYVKVGSSFEVDDLKITVNEADTDFKDYDNEYGWNTPQDGMKYVMISFTYENIGESGDRYASIYDFECYADNTSYEQVYALDENDFMNANLSPGRNLSFKVYFEVPEDSESIELEYTENIWTDKKVLIKLQ